MKTKLSGFDKQTTRGKNSNASERWIRSNDIHEMSFIRCIIVQKYLFCSIFSKHWSHSWFHDAKNIYFCIWAQKNERNFGQFNQPKHNYHRLAKRNFFFASEWTNQPTNERINVFCICIHYSEKLHGLMYYATPMNI